MKKFICFLLACMTVVVLVACANPGDGDDNPSTSDTTSSSGSPSDTTPQAPDTTSPNEADDLGDVRFEGSTYDIISRESTAYEVESSGISGDLVADAVHQRNVSVEERFGVKVNVIKKPGDWATRDDFMNAVSNSVLAGTHDYDLVMTHSAYIVNLAVNGNGYDLYELDSIDFDKKWWCRKYVDNASMLDRAYTAMGDIGYTLYEYMECVFFNKKLAEDAGVPDLYSMVKAGEWTFEKLKEYSMLVGEDLDGNGVYDSADRYGLGTNGHACRMTATFWETQMTVKNSEGRWTINLPNEKYLKVYDELYSLVYDNPEHVFFIGEGQKVETQMFANDQLMFFIETMGRAVSMKDMTSEYGIVPYPKYNTEQENYVSSARDALSAVLVVKDITEPEMVGAVTEAMCMLGYRNITPVYYETTLKLKYLSEPNAVEMLDLIRDTMTFDFAATYTNSLSLIYSTMGDNIKNGNISITSLVKGSSKIWQKELDKLYTAFEKLNG